MLYIEKLAKDQELHWKVVLEGTKKGESDDFALDLHDIPQTPEIAPTLMNELFITLATQPNYGLSENIKMVIDPLGEARSIQKHGLITFSTKDEPEDRSFILLRFEEGKFHYQAASPKALAIQLKHPKKREQLLLRLINEPKEWYFVGFVMHYSPNYTVVHQNHVQEMFFSLEGHVEESERTLSLSWIFDLLWQAVTAKNYELEADIIAIEDPNGNEIKEATFLTVHMSIEGNKLGILIRIKGDDAIVMGITPEQALTNITEAETPLIHLAEALAAVPETFDYVRVGLVAGKDQGKLEKIKKRSKELENEMKNWIYT